MKLRKEKNKEKICYPVVLTFEEGQEIAVEIPDLDVATSGVSEEDALFSARELLGLVVYGLEEDKEEVPKPSSVRDIHIEDNQMVMLVDVYMPAVRMAQDNKSVSRTVTIPAMTEIWNVAYNYYVDEGFDVMWSYLKKQIKLNNIGQLDAENMAEDIVETANL